MRLSALVIINYLFSAYNVLSSVQYTKVKKALPIKKNITSLYAEKSYNSDALNSVFFWGLSHFYKASAQQICLNRGLY